MQHGGSGRAENPSERSAAAGHTRSLELGGSLGRREAVGLGVDVKVILTPPCILCIENC